MNSYSCLAAYYDRLMGDFDYEGYLSKIIPLIGREGADLCCGSGKIAVALAKEGKKIIASDISAQMLDAARTNAKKQGAGVLFVLSDIRDFTPPHKLDFATCVCDGINYVKQKDIRPLFEKIAGYLKDGGVFVFDVSTSYKLTKILANNEFFEEYDDLTYLWSNKLSKDKITMNISFFVRDTDGKYIKKTEEHTQYIHTQDAIENALQGLFSFEAYDFDGFKKPGAKTSRIVWVCTKR